MPKKWGVNDKKQEAREKEKLKKEEKRIKEQEEKEKKEWEETDKQVLKKLERKQKAQEKKEAEAKKRQEKKELEEKELAELTKGDKPQKITRSEAERIKDKVLKEAMQKAEPAKKPHPKKTTEGGDSEDDLEPIPENVNKIRAAEEEKLKAAGVQVVSATGLADAVNVLSIEDPDRHPEKRMKRAYEDYCDKMLPKIKVEYPGLKRSQYLNMIQKEWKGAPENPMNQPKIAFNEKK